MSGAPPRARHLSQAGICGWLVIAHPGCLLQLHVGDIGIPPRAAARRQVAGV